MATPINNMCLGHLTSCNCQRDVGVGRRNSFMGSGFCSECYYEGIEEEYERYRQLRDEGYSHYQASIQVGWSDPS